MIKKEIEILPNPDAIRFPVIDKCLAHETEIEEEKFGKVEKLNIPMPNCDKVFKDHSGVSFCIAYEKPSAMWRLGCPLASNKIQITDKGKPINPLKASKRGIQSTFSRKKKNR